MRHLFQLTVATLLLFPATLAAQDDTSHTEQTILAGQRKIQVQRTEPIVLNPLQGNADANAEMIQRVCAPIQRKVEAYRLKNVPVQDAADAINTWLKATLETDTAEVNGFICNSPVLLVVDDETNTLLVSTTEDFTQQEGLQSLLKHLDKPPATIKIKSIVKKTNGSSSEAQMLNNSTLVLTENQTFTYSFGTPEGIYTIELTARVLPDGSTNQARSAKATVSEKVAR